MTPAAAAAAAAPLVLSIQGSMAPAAAAAAAAAAAVAQQGKCQACICGGRTADPRMGTAGQKPGGWSAGCVGQG
eukprot:1160360-Pelagomonas_calceolata.AAC.15